MQYIRKGKEILDFALIKVDESKHVHSLDKLIEGKFYGTSQTINLVDQLGNPQPDLVQSYYGLIQDKNAAKRFGTDNLEDYSYWSWRSCGVANVMTILKSYDLYKGTLYNLVKEIDINNGYLHKDKWGRKDVGWKHSSLKEALIKYGLKAEVITRLSISHLLEELFNQKLSILSVKSRNQLGSHMVVASGFTWHNLNTTIRIHDPYNLDKQGGNKEVVVNDFIKIFLNKGIFVWKE